MNDNTTTIGSGHMALTPLEKVCSLMDETPLSEEVYRNYNRSKERIQEANYQTDLAVRRLQNRDG